MTQPHAQLRLRQRRLVVVGRRLHPPSQPSLLNLLVLLLRLRLSLKLLQRLRRLFNKPVHQVVCLLVLDVVTVAGMLVCAVKVCHNVVMMENA